MKKVPMITLLSLFAFAMSAAISYAHEGHHQPTVKHAIHELHEGKSILAKMAPDAEGHIAKAQQWVNQAEQELAAVKVEPTAISEKK